MIALVMQLAALSLIVGGGFVLGFGWGLIALGVAALFVSFAFEDR